VGLTADSKERSWGFMTLDSVKILDFLYIVISIGHWLRPCLWRTRDYYPEMGSSIRHRVS